MTRRLGSRNEPLCERAPWPASRPGRHNRVEVLLHLGREGRGDGGFCGVTRLWVCFRLLRKHAASLGAGSRQPICPCWRPLVALKQLSQSLHHPLPLGFHSSLLRQPLGKGVLSKPPFFPTTCRQHCACKERRKPWLSKYLWSFQPTRAVCTAPGPGYNMLGSAPQESRRLLNTSTCRQFC